MTILILMVGMAVAAPAAQESGHVVEVRSLISRDAIRPGETFKAAVILEVKPGYHINDNAPLDEFMIPTSLVFEDNPDFKVVEIYYPKGRRASFAFSEAELAVYDGRVVLGILLKARGGLAPGVRTLKATLGYQACDDESCLPPKELAFGIAVPVSSTRGAYLHLDIFDKLPFKSLRK